jgi:hypothetical protein
MHVDPDCCCVTDVSSCPPSLPPSLPPSPALLLCVE